MNRIPLRPEGVSPGILPGIQKRLRNLGLSDEEIYQLIAEALEKAAESEETNDEY